LYEIAYFVGFVATFFIPFGWLANLIGRTGKAGKVFLKAYALIDDLMAKVFGFVRDKGKSIFKVIIQFFRTLFRKFSSGKNAIIETIKELIDNFAKWLDDVFPKWKKNKFWKDGIDPDPTFKIWGSGKISHPKLWQKIIDDLISKGVEVKFGDKNLTYGPNPSKGKPGIISLTENCSITALMYEAKHFYDDLSKGFPGWEELFNPKVRWKMEFDAYRIEIDFLKKNNQYDVAKEILENAKKEKLELEELYNIKL